MSKITLSEARDRDIWQGWFEEAKKCNLEDGSLNKFLDHLKNDYQFDYGTSARATAAAAFATANAFAGYIGLTGFLWSCAAMYIIGKMCFPHNKLGYRIVDYDNLLYPQYEHDFVGCRISASGAESLRREAQANIDESNGRVVHPAVMAWWNRLAKKDFPYWLLIEEGGEK